MCVCVCACVCAQSDDLQQYEVEDFIAQLMHQEFDTLVDDGSLPQVCAPDAEPPPRARCHTSAPCAQVSGSLLQIFGQWQQGALQQLQHSVEALSRKTGQRPKVTAAPADSDEDSDPETQVRHTCR